MSFVVAVPEALGTAATDLATIGSKVNAAHMVAAARTTAVIPAAADQVSASIAQLFSQHAADYQAMATKAAAFSGQFVQHLTAGAFSYASVEAFIASLLQNLPANVLASITPLQLANDAATVALILFFAGVGIPILLFAASQGLVTFG